jgi:MFS family permease
MNKFTPLVKGIITGILMVCISLLVHYTNVPADSGLHYSIYIIFAAGIMWTLISFSRSASFTGAFADLFGQGFRCFIVATLMMVAFTAIFSMLHPEFALESAQYYREDLVKKGDKTPAEIDELVARAKKQYTTGIVYLTVFGYLITGAIITAAGSAFLMRRK